MGTTSYWRENSQVDEKFWQSIISFLTLIHYNSVIAIGTYEFNTTSHIVVYIVIKHRYVMCYRIMFLYQTWFL